MDNKGRVSNEVGITGLAPSALPERSCAYLLAVRPSGFPLALRFHYYLAP